MRSTPRSRAGTLFAIFALLLAAMVAVGPAPTAGADDLERQQLEGWAQFLEREGPSHASGNRPELGPTITGNPTTATIHVRVGLYYSYTATGARAEFATLQHPVVRLSNTAGAVRVLDQRTGKKIATMEPGQVFEVRADGAGYAVAGPGGALGVYAGPVRFAPTDAANLFQVESIERINNVTYASYLKPRYRGAMEVARGNATVAGKVNLVNIVELEHYVRGVVVNESPASFHVEALKAQATAARGYAVANIGRYQRLGYPFDLVDSPASQVYRGATSEQPRGNDAADGTRALVASYQGKIITAYYSSSMGGHTENVEWSFNEPNTKFPGDNTTPYLRGVYDGAGAAPTFADEAGVRAFWTAPQPQTFDSCERTGNRFARWRMDIPAATIEARLKTVPHTVVSGSATGAVTGVAVQQRMDASGRIGVARVTLTGGVVDIKGWRNVRAMFGTTAKPEPAICSTRITPANFPLTNPSVLDTYTKADGSFGGVIAHGGGFGHNIGLSQFGAHGRGLAGQHFIQILKGYYSGVDIGSFPVTIERGQGDGPPTLRQQFATPTGQGVLEIRPQGLTGLRIHINETYDISLTAEDLAQEVVRLDIGAYLHPGLNVIQYNPVGDGSATALVIVE